MGHVQALWQQNNIDPNDRDAGFDNPEVSSAVEPEHHELPDFTDDSFVASCLDVRFKESPDDRWFSHFKELPEIDSLNRTGRDRDALELCKEGQKRYPDSFHFYMCAARLHDALNEPVEAERLLLEGLEKSLSKCSITQLADRAF